MEANKKLVYQWIKKHKYSAVIFLYTLTIGLIPLLWFTGNEFITGTDVNFSPFPTERLEKRFYTWDPTLFKGSNRSNNMSTLSYIATSGLLAEFITNPVTVEKITYVIWFTLTGVSIAFLLEKVFGNFKEKEKLLIKMFGITIYMINFYNVFLWVRLQLNVTSLVFIPILFAILYSIFALNKLSKSDILVLAIATVLGGSMGQQPPIIYATVMAAVIFVITFVLLDLFQNKKIILEKMLKAIIALIVTVLSGAYWMLPQASHILKSSLLNDADAAVDVYNIESLLSWTSSVASNLNVVRMFGDVVWFDGWNFPYFPEFITQYNNKLFTVASFIFPTIIFLPFFKAKKNRKAIIAFGLITLMSIFYSKGIHPPFEGIFKWSFANLPGFWVHRAPWQKFGVITILGYAVLGGYGFYLLVEIISKFLQAKAKTNKPTLLVTVVVLVLYGTFNNLFIKGVMFPSKESDIGYHGYFNLGFHHTYPQYIYETRDYLMHNGPKENYSILLLPELKTSVYDWGYAGATDIVSIFTKKSTLFSPYGEGFVLDGYITNVYSSLVALIYNSDSADPQLTNNLNYVFNFYNIRYILQRNDFTYNFFSNLDSPEFISQSLQKLNIDNKTTFGKWDLNSIPQEQSVPRIYASNKLIDVTGMKKNILLPLLYQNDSDIILVSKAPKVDQTFAQRYVSATIDTNDSECRAFCFTFNTTQNNKSIKFYEDSYNKLDEQNYQKIINEKKVELIGPNTITTKAVRHKDVTKEDLVNTIHKPSNQQLKDALINNYKLTNVTGYRFENIDSELPQEYKIKFDFLTSEEFLVVFANVDIEGNLDIIATNLAKKPDETTLTAEKPYKTFSGTKAIELFIISNTDIQLVDNVVLERKIVPNAVSIETLEADSTPAPEINFEKINPTKYSVYVNNLTGKHFNLVFNQTYNPYWKLYATNGQTRREIPTEQHYMANYYANAWVVYNTDLKPGEHLIIEYYLQQLFYIGAIISTSAVSVIVLINLVFRKKHD